MSFGEKSTFNTIDVEAEETTRLTVMPSPATLPSLHPVLARRSSYTSMVHQEREQKGQAMGKDIDVDFYLYFIRLI